MCDTMVATRAVTADGRTLFAKNSDREPNEAHFLQQIPAADHAPGSTVRCTYVSIPQVAHTYAVLLAKPFWIWGAEIGTNEHGVVIGNEAVFTKMPYEKGDALIGMDLLRLALERGKTAKEALLVITELLETHGQGGNCGFQHKLFYHNGYLLADAQEAWVLETAGKEWAARRVDGVYTISNGITISTEWDLASPGLVETAVRRGWCKNAADFDFARCYSDFIYTRFSDCRHRCASSRQFLEQHAGAITVQTMIAALRDHGAANPTFRPDNGISGAEVCMHAGFGPIRGSQTTGSLVSHLHPDHPTHFCTGTAAPCTSIFKPVWQDAPLPAVEPQPQGTYDEATLFWRHEALHRETLRDYPTRMAVYQHKRDEMEDGFITTGLSSAADSADTRADLTASCFALAAAAESDWLAMVQATPPQKQNALLHRIAWRGFNQQAQMG